MVQLHLIMECQQPAAKIREHLIHKKSSGIHFSFNLKLRMDSIFMLVYTSKSSNPIDEDLLGNILNKCRENNKRDDITGFLVTRSGYFLQLLEGKEKDVLACFERINLDRRHRLITLQGTAKMSSRLMPEWNMGFVEDNEHSKKAEILLDLFELGRAGQAYTNKEPLERMLKKFSENSKALELK